MSNLFELSDTGQVVDDEIPRRVGRPSVRDQRRDEILDAAVEVILEFGIAGATRARVAERAGLRPSAVHHFVGTQSEVLRATVERIGRRLTTELIVDDSAVVDPLERVLATIDASFGSVVDDPAVNRLVDELVAHSYRDDDTRDSLARIYRTATDRLAIEVERAWGPGSSAEARTAAAEIVTLAHAAGSFRHLGLMEHADTAHRRARHLVVGGRPSRP